MIIFPDQFGPDKTDTMTFAESQHYEEKSAYEPLRVWLEKHFGKKVRNRHHKIRIKIKETT